MATRTGTARWQGSIGEGGGTVAVGSGAFDGPYSSRSRFEDGDGTNPEELIAAAYAGCFSMAKDNCPVSKALRGVAEITLDAELAA